MPFAGILGQERAVARVRRAWVAGRLPQAYCFAGPSGIGKRTTALALAQAVNCLAPVAGGTGADDACGACVACHKIGGGLHPDVVEVRPEGKTVITIDQVREVTGRATLRPYEGRRPVWILDPADLMQEPAANALLKTLEEPAGASLFVLVTAAPSALLPTILSRCQVVRFDPLGEAHLREILAGHGRTPPDAAAAAALAGGSAERALALDVAEARATRERLVAQVWDALDSPVAILKCAEELARDRAALEAALTILAGFTRDLGVAKMGGTSAPLVSADRQPETARLAAGYPLSAILDIFAAQIEAQRAVARHANPRLTAERMLLRMRQAIERGQEGVHGTRGSR
jgi:DNA polymerase-3 subunit delta'